MLLTIDAEKPMAKVREDLQRACADHKFGVLAVLDLKEKMKEKGVDYAGEVVVFEVCNPHKAKQALEANVQIATALPCRIAAYPSGKGKVRLQTIKPTFLIGQFGTKSLEPLAREVEGILESIMKQAAKP